MQNDKPTQFHTQTASTYGHATWVVYLSDIQENPGSMPKTPVDPKKRRSIRKKPAPDLIILIATDPRLLQVEVGSSAPGVKTFCFSIYASKEADRPTGMSKLSHQNGFCTLQQAISALMEKLKGATKHPGTKFTSAHLTALERQMSTGAKSYSIPLRNIVRAVQ